MHGGLSPSIDTLDHIRALDRIQEVPHEVSIYVSANLCVCMSVYKATLLSQDLFGGFMASHALHFLYGGTRTVFNSNRALHAICM